MEKLVKLYKNNFFYQKHLHQMDSVFHRKTVKERVHISIQFHFNTTKNLKLKKCGYTLFPG